MSRIGQKQPVAQAIEWRNGLDYVRWQPAMSVSYYPWVRLWDRYQSWVDPAGGVQSGWDLRWEAQAPTDHGPVLYKSKKRALRVAQKHINELNREHTDRVAAALDVYRPYREERDLGL